MNNNGHTTPASVWRKTVTVTLPQSGHTVEIRSFDMTILTILGRIPDGLTPLVNKVIEATLKGQRADVIDEINQLKPLERYHRMLDIASAACQYAFVHPRIVDDPHGEDEIALSDVHPNDRLFVFNFIGVPAHKLESFRDQQAANVESVPDESAGGHGRTEPDTTPE